MSLGCTQWPIISLEIYGDLCIIMLARKKLQDYMEYFDHYGDAEFQHNDCIADECGPYFPK